MNCLIKRTLMPCALLLLVVIVPGTSQAVTRRAAQGSVVISPTETISDSLFASGDNVTVQGRIEGNLFMAGERLELTGDVDGDLFAAGQEVRISGNVTGSIMAAAQTIVIDGHNGGNLYGAARTLRIEKNGKVAQDAIAGAQTVDVEGEVGRGLTAGANNVSIEGMIGRGVTFAGNRMVVQTGAGIGGDIRARVADAKQVLVEPGASVQGAVNVSPAQDRRSPWTRPATYIWEAAKLLAAFLTGWLILALFPGFFRNMADRVGRLRSLGIGFLALILIPIAAVILLVTLVLIPISVGAMFLYLAGLYLSQIFVAGYLGRELFHRHSSMPPTLGALLAGLVILHLLFLAPFGVGTLARVVVCSMGMGAAFLELHARVRPATLATA